MQYKNIETIIDNCKIFIFCCWQTDKTKWTDRHTGQTRQIRQTDRKTGETSPQIDRQINRQNSRVGYIEYKKLLHLICLHILDKITIITFWEQVQHGEIYFIILPHPRQTHPKRPNKLMLYMARVFDSNQLDLMCVGQDVYMIIIHCI